MQKIQVLGLNCVQFSGDQCPYGPAAPAHGLVIFAIDAFDCAPQAQA